MAIEFPSLGGYITDSKEFTDKQFSVACDNGIFSEQVFGPLKSFKCKCGLFSTRSININKVCPKCGVMCCDNSIRMTTFGKIKLPINIISPSKIKILRKHIKNFEPILTDVNKLDAVQSQKRYLAISHDRTKLRIVKSLIDPNFNKKFTIIPLRITGLYTLYLSLLYVQKYLPCELIEFIFENKIYYNEIKVLPAGIRPVLYDPITKKQMSPNINKHYRSVLTKNKTMESILANKEQDEIECLEMVNVNLMNFIEEDISSPINFHFDQIAITYQTYASNIYDEICKQISGKEGLIRSAILSKTIDFSARTVVRSDPSLYPYQIRVSKKILRKLWTPYFIYWLTHYKNFEYDQSCSKLVLGDSYNDDKMVKLFDEFLEWFYDETNQEETRNETPTSSGDINCQYDCY